MSSKNTFENNGSRQFIKAKTYNRIYNTNVHLLSNIYRLPIQNEWRSYLPNRKYIRGLQIPDNIPAILVSTNSWNLTPSQSKIIEKHLNARHFILEGSHDVYNIYPERIIGFIRELANTPEPERDKIKAAFR